MASKDPLVNAIYEGIKKGINVTYDSKCLGSCLILIYSGIDSMAYLSLPSDRDSVRAEDFISWAERYMTPRLTNELTKVTGEELYSARCGLVHTYTMESRRTRDQNVRKIGYQYGGGMNIFSSPTVPDAILLRIDYFRDAFFSAIDEFLVRAYSATAMVPVLEKRMNKLMVMVEYGTKYGDATIQPI